MCIYASAHQYACESVCMPAVTFFFGSSSGDGGGGSSVGGIVCVNDECQGPEISQSLIILAFPAIKKNA